MKKLFISLFALILGVGSISAEAPYKHSVGAYFGGLNGFTYKKYVREHFAVNLDLGVGLTAAPSSVYCFDDGEQVSIGVATDAGTQSLWDLTFNPNFLGTGHIAQNWSMYGGGGLNIGICGYIHNYGYSLLDFAYQEKVYGKLGLNLMWGVEYKMPNKPVAIGFDFRPGMGIAYHAPTINITNDVAPTTETGLSMCSVYLDWKVAMSVRYCWGN